MAKVCPMDGTSKREDMKNLIYTLSKNIPMIRANLFGAIQRNLDDWKRQGRVKMDIFRPKGTGLSYYSVYDSFF